MLTMWDEFATVQASELGKILSSGRYPLIFTKRVAATSFQGLSLTTRYDTSIEINPTTPQALTLREWSTSNTTSIENLL
ncbi:unnamed protein product [Cuscuta campestris]|uniref:Replication protein A OB domain-containing protein n=1 Tax=Cuscuta campestris TaxID=132261 RepID=A0A484LWE0_9ASTE|nr:unnamed protein product [Cuscuta campestris]